MAKINVTAAPGGGGGGSGTVTSVGLTSTTLTITGSPITTSGTMTANLPDGYLKVGTGVTGTLQNVTDTSGTASQLFLSTTGIQATSKIQITTAETSYIDAEDNSGNNRFTVGRDPASQLVTVDFASVPTALTTPVGAIRTATDGVTLANVMTFLENGNIGLGTDTPGSKLDVHSTGATVAQFNKTVSGNSYIQQLTAGAGKWKHGFTSATGAFDIIDDVNSLTRLSLLNTGQLKLNAYTSTSAFTGTTAGFLAFDTSGNILSVTSPATSPAGTTGAVQFNNAGAFGADSTNFFWNNTTKALGIGTATPSGALTFGAAKYIEYQNLSSSTYIGEIGINNNLGIQITGNNPIRFLTNSTERIRIFGNGNTAFGSTTDLSATLGVKGSGSTSATTSLLVQNSGGASSLQVKDDGSVFNYGKGAVTGNTAFGDGALITNTSGNYNAAHGAFALQLNTTGTENCAVGAYTLFQNTSGLRNTAIGQNALSNLTTGNRNTAIGYNARVGNFSESVVIGCDATATASNQFVVGSVGTNAGTITAGVNTSTQYWNVIINGVACKILLA